MNEVKLNKIEKALLFLLGFCGFVFVGGIATQHLVVASVGGVALSLALLIALLYLMEKK